MLELILLVVIVAIFLINRKSKFTQNTRNTYSYLENLKNLKNPLNLDDHHKLDTTEFVVSKDCCATQYKPMCGIVKINDEREFNAFDAGSGCDLNDVDPKVTSDMINTNFFSTGSTESTNSGCVCATKKSFEFLRNRGQN